MRARPTLLLAAAVVTSAATLVFAAPAERPAPAPNGVELPTGYQDWREIGTSHRTDNNTLRVILGNDVAIGAAREGRTNPWPDGAVLAKLVWKDATHEQFPAATVPGNFVHAEFMVKDSEKYASTGGWGFGRWLGADQNPYGKDPHAPAMPCRGPSAGETAAPCMPRIAPWNPGSRASADTDRQLWCLSLNYSASLR